MNKLWEMERYLHRMYKTNTSCTAMIYSILKNENNPETLQTQEAQTSSLPSSPPLPPLPQTRAATQLKLHQRSLWQTMYYCIHITLLISNNLH
jgi:hypothetical protein